MVTCKNEAWPFKTLTIPSLPAATPQGTVSYGIRRRTKAGVLAAMPGHVSLEHLESQITVRAINCKLSVDHSTAFHTLNCTPVALRSNSKAVKQ